MSFVTRLTNEGRFESPFFHIDLAGPDLFSFSTSTTFNENGAGTLVLKESAPIFENATGYEQGETISYRDSRPEVEREKSIRHVEGVRLTYHGITELNPKEILLNWRVPKSNIDWSLLLRGKLGLERQRKAIVEAKPWHSSPAYVPGMNPRRLWIGVYVQFSD